MLPAKTRLFTPFDIATNPLKLIYWKIQSRLINPNFFNPEPLHTDSKSPITEFPSVI